MDRSLQARLAAAGIQLAAETASHYLLARGEFIALVELATLSPGSTGMLTENGLAYLVWRGGEARLKSRTADLPATADQVDAIRAFSRDLEAALRRPDMLT